MKLYAIKDQFKEEIVDVKKKNIRLQRKTEEVEMTIENIL